MKATYVMDFGAEAYVICSHWLSLELTIWGSCIFSSKSHQVLTCPLLQISRGNDAAQPQRRAPGSSSQGWPRNSWWRGVQFPVCKLSQQPTQRCFCKSGRSLLGIWEPCDSARSNSRCKLMFALVPLFVPQRLLHNSGEGSWEKDKHQQGRQLANWEH